jgi:quercetin dioxygenase-like cupin family protein
MDCCIKTNVRSLINKETGAQNSCMRLFEMEAGGFSSMHKHSGEHHLFIVEGDGLIFNGHDTLPFHAGDVIFIPANELHLIKNNTKKPLNFICTGPHPEE